MKSRSSIRQFLDIQIQHDVVEFDVLEEIIEAEYRRQLVAYKGSEDDEIRAYIFIPTKAEIIGSLLVHHQHHSERNLGKSEVAGLAGSPYQAFCPALAKKGIVSLAPDSICFEDRRPHLKGMEIAEDEDDEWLHHYNEMCYRILRGETLMKKVIEDASIAVSLLSQLPFVDTDKIGSLGHSYGGNTVIFQTALDERLKYNCSSGAACSYQNKMEHGTGMEMALVIPGFYNKYDISDLIQLVAPRKYLIVSGKEDKYSKDAEALVSALISNQIEIAKSLEIRTYPGGHSLDQERFNFIIDWFEKVFTEPEHSS